MTPDELRNWMATTPHTRPAVTLPSWSVADLAAATGYSRAHIYEVLSGETPISKEFEAVILMIQRPN